MEVRGFVFVFVCTRKMYKNLSLSLFRSLSKSGKSSMCTLYCARLRKGGGGGGGGGDCEKGFYVHACEEASMMHCH